MTSHSYEITDWLILEFYEYKNWFSIYYIACFAFVIEETLLLSIGRLVIKTPEIIDVCLPFLFYVTINAWSILTLMLWLLFKETFLYNLWAIFVLVITFSWKIYFSLYFRIALIKGPMLFYSQIKSICGYCSLNLGSNFLDVFIS